MKTVKPSKLGKRAVCVLTMFTELSGVWDRTAISAPRHTAGGQLQCPRGESTTAPCSDQGSLMVWDPQPLTADAGQFSTFLP